jgi:hypothetical protein
VTHTSSSELGGIFERFMIWRLLQIGKIKYSVYSGDGKSKRDISFNVDYIRRYDTLEHSKLFNTLLVPLNESNRAFDGVIFEDNNLKQIFVIQFTISKHPFQKLLSYQMFENKQENIAQQLIKINSGEDCTTNINIKVTNKENSVYTPDDSNVIYLLISPHKISKIKLTQKQSSSDSKWMGIISQESLGDTLTPGMIANFNKRMEDKLSTY